MAEAKKTYDSQEVQPIDNPMEVLENIRRLRSARIGREAFREAFLSNISVLCRAAAVVYCEKEPVGWVVCHEYAAAKPLSGRGAQFLGVAIRLMDLVVRNGFAYERLNFALPPMLSPILLATGIDVEEDGRQTALLLILEQGTPQQLNDIILRTQLIRDVPLCHDRTSRTMSQSHDHPPNQLFSHTLEVIDAVVHKKRFMLSALTLANEIADRFDCSQVSLGWNQGHYVRTIAVSRVEKFDRHSEILRHLQSVFEEAFEQDATVSWPDMESGRRVNTTHREYANTCRLTQVVSIPMRLDDEIIAVATLEKQSRGLSALEIDTVSLVLSQVAHWLNALYRNDRWIGGRLVMGLRKRLDFLLGAGNSLIKAAGIGFMATLACSIIGTWPYRIEGPAVLKTDSVSYLSAPFDGVVQDVTVHEGNVVKKGALLLMLDEKELRLKEAETGAQIVRYQREADKQRAVGALADMQIALSQAQEARVNLDKIRYYLSQTRLTAPGDGVIVEGDKQKLIGSPVSRGDILLKIARVESMYAHIRISERDIGESFAHAKGNLRLISRPDQVFPISVETIIPMATVDQREGNVFVVNARIDSLPQAWWRPGMSGLAKIDVGEKRIIWIMMHRIMDFIRMHLWW